MRLIDATSLPRAMICGGSINLDVPSTYEPLSESVIEGNAAHKLAEMVLKGLISNPQDMVDRQINNNFIVTDDMAENIEEVLYRLAARQLPIYTELNTDWFCITGRADFVQYSEKTRTIFIDDLKYGWRIVEPENNWTLISHAIGCAMKYGWQFDTICLTIHQPRPWHRDGQMRSWTIGIHQLRAFERQITERFNALPSEFVTSPACYKCKGLSVCEAARQAALNAVDISTAPYVETLRGDQIAYEIVTLERALTAIEHRLDAIRALAEEKLRSGKETVRGFGLEKAFGKSRWKPFVTVDTVKAITGIDATERRLMTLTAAKKAGIPEAVIETLKFRPETGFKLVRQDIDKTAKKLLQPQPKG